MLSSTARLVNFRCEAGGRLDKKVGAGSAPAAFGKYAASGPTAIAFRTWRLLKMPDSFQSTLQARLPEEALVRAGDLVWAGLPNHSAELRSQGNRRR